MVVSAFVLCRENVGFCGFDRLMQAARLLHLVKDSHEIVPQWMF